MKAQVNVHFGSSEETNSTCLERRVRSVRERRESFRDDGILGSEYEIRGKGSGCAEELHKQKLSDVKNIDTMVCCFG